MFLELVALRVEGDNGGRFQPTSDASIGLCDRYCHYPPSTSMRFFEEMRNFGMVDGDVCIVNLL